MCKIFGHNIKLTILLKANRSMVDNTRKLVYGSSIFGKFMSNLNTKFQKFDNFLSCLFFTFY